MVAPQREGGQDERAPTHLPIRQLRNQLNTNKKQVDGCSAGARRGGVDRDVRQGSVTTMLSAATRRSASVALSTHQSCAAPTGRFGTVLTTQALKIPHLSSRLAFFVGPADQRLWRSSHQPRGGCQRRLLNRMTASIQNR